MPKTFRWKMRLLQGKTYPERAKECRRLAEVCPEDLKESYLEMAAEFEQLARGPSRMKIDVYDGEPWTEMDIEDLTAALKHGSTIEDAAKHLCRTGTVNDVRRKAEELGLKYTSRKPS